jgi:hypothetical protein
MHHPNQDPPHDTGDDAPMLSTRAVELGVALLTAAIGAVVMHGSYKEGIAWDVSGPQSGTFPFYIGAIMLAASAGTIFFTLRDWRALAACFIARGPFRHVAAVFVPICIYGIAIRLLGMYLASAMLIAWFMWRDTDEEGQRRYRMPKIAMVSIGVVVASYLIFERWFEVPLYAGPIVEWFGSN